MDDGLGLGVCVGCVVLVVGVFSYIFVVCDIVVGIVGVISVRVVCREGFVRVLVVGRWVVEFWVCKLDGREWVIWNGWWWKLLVVGVRGWGIIGEWCRVWE